MTNTFCCSFGVPPASVDIQGLAIPRNDLGFVVIDFEAVPMKGAEPYFSLISDSVPIAVTLNLRECAKVYHS